MKFVLICSAVIAAVCCAASAKPTEAFFELPAVNVNFISSPQEVQGLETLEEDAQRVASRLKRTPGAGFLVDTTLSLLDNAAVLYIFKIIPGAETLIPTLKAFLTLFRGTLS